MLVKFGDSSGSWNCQDTGTCNSQGPECMGCCHRGLGPRSTCCHLHNPAPMQAGERERACVCLNKCACVFEQVCVCVCVCVCVQQRHKLSAEPFRCVTETANRTSAEGSSLVGGANAVCIAVHVNSTSCIVGTALVRAVIVLAPFTRKPLWTTAHAHADNGVCVCVSVCVCA